MSRSSVQNSSNCLKTVKDIWDKACLVKLLRGHFIDMTGMKLERTINDSLFKKIMSHSSEFLLKRKGIGSVIREFEGVRDFFTTACMVAFIDLPFMFLFLGVIYMIAGPLAIVPILIVPLVLGVSAIIQPFLKRYSKFSIYHFMHGCIKFLIYHFINGYRRIFKFTVSYRVQ